MLPDLTANQARVIGCLMEKSIVTPDQYPMTLNALTAACNQKSSRDPVMSLEPIVVQRTTRELGTKHLVVTEENFRRGVEKYRHRFCNTQHSDYQFDSAEFAIVCLLLLRGPQTPGEIRARSGRLHSFADNSAVVAALGKLIEREHEPLLIKLPRLPGRKDAQYMHLFSGPVDIAASASRMQDSKAAGAAPKPSLSELVQRIESLEADVAELKRIR